MTDTRPKGLIEPNCRAGGRHGGDSAELLNGTPYIGEEPVVPAAFSAGDAISDRRQAGNLLRESRRQVFSMLQSAYEAAIAMPRV